VWPLDRMRRRAVIRVGPDALELWATERAGLRLVGAERLARRGSLYDALPLGDALGALCKRLGCRRALLVLESAYAPVQLVDTGGALSSTSQLDALLRHRLELAYGIPGSDIGTWRVRTDHRFGRRQALAFALPKSVESALRDAERSFALVFDAWVPALAWSLDRFRPWRTWPAGTGWWGWPEQDRLLLAYVAHGRVEAFNPALRTDASIPAIRRAIGFERARSGSRCEASSIGIGHWADGAIAQQVDDLAQAAA